MMGWGDNVAIYAVTVATRYFKDLLGGFFCQVHWEAGVVRHRVNGLVV